MKECIVEECSVDMGNSGSVATVSYNAHLIARYLTEECCRKPEKNGDTE